MVESEIDNANDLYTKYQSHSARGSIDMFPNEILRGDQIRYLI